MADFLMPRGSLKLRPPNLLAEEILENNNLTKISIPTEGKNNLFKALSFALFMNLDEESMIQGRLITQLKTLIQEKNLSLKLAMFENDLMLFKDYCSNCHFHGFDKVTLELASHCFEVRIIVYSISEENYLNSTIYNKRFDKTISLLKSGAHFDVAVERSKFELMSFAQNLVYEFLLGVLGIEGSPYKPYFIASLESPYDKPEPLFENFDVFSPPPENKLKPKHKKSRSDNFNVANEKIEEKSAFYNLFNNLQAPKDFLTSITPSNSSRFAKNFNSEKAKDNESIFRFPNSNLTEKRPIQAFNPFNKSKPFDSEQNISNQLKPPKPNKPPMFYVGTTPPGLTPKKQNVEQTLGQFKTNIEDDLQFLGKNQFQIPPEKKKLKTFKPNEEENLFQSRNQFTLSDQNVLVGGNNQMFDNFGYKGAAPLPGKFFGYSSNPFMDQENTNTYNLNKEESTFKSSGGLANLPQKPDLNQMGQNYFYANFNSNTAPLIQSEELKEPNIFENVPAMNTKKTGRLKFFDEAKNYGFIIMDEDGSDIFVHFDDLAKAGVVKDLLRTAKQGNIIRFSFNCMNYIGKYNKSKKAVDLTLLNSFI